MNRHSSREMQHIFENFYRQRTAGATTDEDELTLARDLLGKALAGGFPTEDGQFMSLGNVRSQGAASRPVAANSVLLQQAEEASLAQALKGSWTTYIGLLGLVIALFYGLSMMLGGTSTATPPAATPLTTPLAASGSEATGEPDAPPVPTVGPTATLGPTPTPPPLPNFPADPERALAPISIELGTTTFPIYPTRVQPGLVWGFVPDPHAVSWLEGSYLNTVLALPWSSENEALVRAITAQELIVVRFNTGQTYTYQFTTLEEVNPYEIEQLRQGAVGLTLVLVAPPSDAQNRLVLRAAWHGSAASAASAPSSSALSVPTLSSQQP